MRPFAPTLAASLAGWAAPGCGPQVGDPSGGSTGGPSATDPSDPDSGGPGASAAMTGPAATSASTGGDADGTTAETATFGGPGDDDPPDPDGGIDFIDPPDVYCAPPLPSGTKATTVFACDLFAQDCPAGSKCAPAALCDATVWNSAACTPLDPNPAQVGDPCAVRDGITSGIDDCDIGLWCGFVDPDTLEGVCTQLCTGSEDNPICESDTQVCTLAYDVMALCLEGCAPLLDDCALGTCVPSGDGFACFQDGASIAPGQPCEYLDDCAAGSVCASATTTGDCGGSFDCCTSLCDLSFADPDAACLPGQTCTPWYRPGSVSPPLDAIGVCTTGG